MKTPFLVLCLLLTLHKGYSQMTSDKSGDIAFNGQPIAAVEKYGGNAQTRPKFWVVSASKDTLLHIKFCKEFDSDWMQWDFKSFSKVVEINTGEIIKGLNYRKNIASYLVENNLITPDGKLSDTAFARLAGNHTENLTEKYHTLNEMNRKIASSSFFYHKDGDKLEANGKIVGYISVADGQGVLINNITVYDLNRNVVGTGSRGTFGALPMKMRDGKVLQLTISDGSTMSSMDKIRFVSILIRELCRNGYYPL